MAREAVDFLVHRMVLRFLIRRMATQAKAGSRLSQQVFFGSMRKVTLRARVDLDLAAALNPRRM